MPGENRQLEIFSDLLETAKRNFEAETKHSATVDDKAQKASGLAGILIAIAFALVKPDALDALQQRYGTLPLILLYLSLLLFLACILTCLTAMWLRNVPVGGISVQAQELSARLLLSIHHIDDELMAVYLENQLQVWKSIIQERHTANVEKTNLIHRAQQVLAAGIVAALISLTVMGFMAGKSAVPSEGKKHMPDQKQNPNPLHLNAPPVKHQSDNTQAPGNDVGVVNGAGQIRSVVEAKKEVIERLSDPAFVAEQLSAVNRLR